MEKLTLNRLVEQTDKDMSDVMESMTDVYNISHKVKNYKKVTNDDLDKLLVYSADAFSKVKSWQDFYRSFTEIIDTHNKEVSDLKSKIKALETEIEYLKQERDSLKQERDIVEISQNMRDTLNKIEEHATIIANSEGARRKWKGNKGVNSSRYIQELDTEELIRVYKEHNNSLPKDVSEYYKRQYGITYNGLRERLIKAGVWKAH